MEKTRLGVSTYYEAVKCECGGTYLEPADMTVFATSPQQRDYKCSNCSKLVRLFQQDWPQLKYDIMMPPPVSETPPETESKEEPTLVKVEEVN